jgi:ubiquinone/menaquinone biosynthesis C-methylase UbiE
MSTFQRRCRQWFEDDYATHGLGAQRSYPNEELMRFLSSEKTADSGPGSGPGKVLEVGCGSCANLWAVAREGFEAHGLDLSTEGLDLGGKVLQNWGVLGFLASGTMTSLPYKDETFDAVIDVLASYCLLMTEFSAFLEDVHRVLRRGGRYFSFTLSTRSSPFTDPGPSRKIDPCTLDGIRRKNSPFYGNMYPVRFTDPDGLQPMLEKAGFKVAFMELSSRTYGHRAEQVEFISAVAEKHGEP